MQLATISSYEEYLKVTQTSAESLRVSTQCCPVEEYYESSFIVSEGYQVCSVCGKVGERILDDEPGPEGMFTATTGINPGYNFSVYRAYKPMNHFREHLRRYMGSRSTSMNLELLKINIKNRRAYFYIKKQLKKLKMRREYKNIWSILYKLGGEMPAIDNILFHRILNCFGEFMSKYPLHQGERKSVPSHDMLLSAILQKLGYKPYYYLPLIQSRSIRDNVFYIIKKCLG